ncbi:unnamed protein product [Lymnaea stagnalis]|uniref:Lipoma HMGIC fusion partner-like 3 protein n=1 Tax=Lymnaea stagnalis TaxID=6523 RepID=A0AAV2HHK1_LYMST
MEDAKYTEEMVLVYHFKYMREYRGVSVLWAVLTIIWCILNIVCFVQPQWIGDTEESIGYGHIGVYAYCYPDAVNGKYICSGSFTDFDTILNGSFKASTFFCGVAALLMLITVAALMLFFCFKKTAVFVFCGILELVVAIFMFLACVIFPSGWGEQRVYDLCGAEAGEYKIGKCGVRWAYILAMLGIFDAFVLALLAFFLASKRAKPGKQARYVNGTVTKSELNGGYSETMSKKSIAIQPQVLAVPADGVGGEPDRYSEFSRHSEKPRSRGGFQL